MIPQSFISELLARADIVQLIESYINLKKVGGNYQALCPFHQEKTPSFVVSSSKQIYHCFGCGVGGNAIGFLMEYERLSFVDAVEVLAKRLGLTVPYENENQRIFSNDNSLYELMEQAAKFYQMELRRNPNAKSAIDYLKQRGLTGGICKRFGVGFVSSSWDGLLNAIGTSEEIRKQLLLTGMLIQKENGRTYDRFRDRVMFPIRDRRGRVIGFGGRVIDDSLPKYLNSPETPIFKKGSELYGFYEAKNANRNLEYLIVVEGYMDVVALVQNGITSAVATLGTATTPYHIEKLFRACSKVVFCFDGDAAGKKAAWRAAEIILPIFRDEWQPQFLFLPEGEDPDSMVRKEGKENFKKRILNATTLSQFFFEHISANIDLSQSEGRSRFAKQAMNYIDAIPGEFCQNQFIQQLAKLISMDESRLQKFIKKPTAKLRNSSFDFKKFKFSPIRIVIMLLMQDPELIENAKDVLPETDMPGISLLKELIEIIKNNPKIKTAAILEYWRDKPEYEIITSLAYEEHLLPSTGVAAEFKEAFTKLKLQISEARIESLMTKASLANLSTAERDELSKLLMQIKK